MTMFRALAPALTLWAASPRGLRIAILTADGQAQDLTGRSFSLVVRRSTMLEPIFAATGVLSGDGYSYLILLSAAQCTAIYEAGADYALAYDVIETTYAGSTPRWTGRVDPQPSASLPATDVEPSVIDLPVADMVAETDNILISERGAQGFGVEKRLKDLGDIDEATPEAMRDKIRAWGGEGGAPYADAAAAAAGQADSAMLGAEAEADRAEGQADRAKDEADRAELSATQATLGSPIYDNAAAGLAATSVGQKFTAYGPDDLTYATLYRHDAGPIATPLRAFSSKVALDLYAAAVSEVQAAIAAEIEERQSLIMPVSGDGFTFRDAMRFVLARLSTDGGFRTAFADLGYTNGADFIIRDALRHIGFKVGRDGVVSFAGLRFVAGDGSIKVIDGAGFVAMLLSADSFRIHGDAILTRIEDLIARQPSIDKGISHVLRKGPTQLRRWRMARASVLQGVGRRLLICIGDSNTMGWDVLGSGQHRRALAYPRVLAGQLGRRLLPAGETSFFGQAITTTSNTSYATYDPRVTFGAGWGINGVTSIGGQAFANSTTLNPLTISPGVAWDTAEIYVGSATDSSFSFDIGGTAEPHSVAGGVAQRVTYSKATGAEAINLRRIDGDVQILGGFFHNSAVPSLCVLNVGRSGWRASDWVSTASFNSPLNALLAMLAYETRATAILELGLNEFNQNIDVTTYKTNMQTIITALLGANCDVVLQISLPPDGVKTYAWASYAQAVYELAAANDLPVNDMTSRLIDFATASADGFATTSLHLSDEGQADKALALAAYLTSH